MNSLFDSWPTLAADADNRSSSVTLSATTVDYLYGPDGSRLKKVTPSGTMLYLGDAEKDAAGGWTTYLNPDVRRAGGSLAYLHRDHLPSQKAANASSPNRLPP